MKKHSYFKSKQEALQFIFWVATLESGVLPRGEERLQSASGYCCLGVGQACFVNTSFILEGVLPSKYTNSPDWLMLINNDFELRTGVSLTKRNDLNHWSHPRIAKALIKAYTDYLNYWF